MKLNKNYKIYRLINIINKKKFYFSWKYFKIYIIICYSIICKITTYSVKYISIIYI